MWTWLVKLIALIQMPKRKMTADRIELFEKTVEIGDIIRTRDNWSFGNLFIVGYWKHAAVVVAKGEYGHRVLEAVTHGTRCVSLVECLMNKDHADLSRCKIISKADRDAIETSYKQFVGLPYDFKFHPGSESIYCSEMAVLLFNKIKPTVLFKKTRILFSKYYMPSIFINTDDWHTVIGVDK